MNYEKIAMSLKALAEPNRLKIVDLLSCGTKCACELLEHFDFSQPALSHHMKVLEKAEIITVEKKGTWNYYTLSDDFAKEFQSMCMTLFSHNEDTCVCGTDKKCNCSN
ncbi:metalloregulator ArsR/SmtB family transcription factor [Lactococcus cremoris]|uniref:ArsR/SmtB family transcription factor n=1 Tax=Lactococcus lactis subsp. cremoris TaxID=1359 RepID=UPI001E5D7B9B|nr:metalloregulator ArsR/SmtB family transcription factor [Lactococcus cremoris]MCD6632027.1 metalloregulator ArsR/SmtB family transcription factor [Lactococcus cremoris]